MDNLASRFWEYLLAAGIYWWAGLAVLLGMERIAERAFPKFWEERVDPWFTPHRRKQALIGFAIVAFIYGSFRAFDEERHAKERAISDSQKTQLDPANLYQNGFPVASIIEPQSDATTNTLVFPAVTASRDLDTAKEFEFRSWKLLCSGEIGSVMTFGAMRQMTYQNFRCRIEGLR